MHQFSRVRYSARHRSLGAAGSASRNERGARRLFERSLATRIPAEIKALVRSVGWLFVFNSNSVRMNQAHRSVALTAQRFDTPHPLVLARFAPGTALGFRTEFRSAVER